MSFRVGQKVACIDDRACPCCGARPLQKGTVYTVHRAFSAWGAPTLTLVEVAVPAAHSGFRAIIFRPVVSRSTDAGMAILRQILADHKTPVKEKA